MKTGLESIQSGVGTVTTNPGWNEPSFVANVPTGYPDVKSKSFSRYCSKALENKAEYLGGFLAVL